MKKLAVMFSMVVMVTTVSFTSACVPAAHMPRAPNAGRRVYDPLSARTPALATAGLPVGRWDNVMMLEVGTPLQVLTMDGAVSSGRFAAATGAMLRVREGSKEREIDVAQIMRVDRLAGGGARSAVRDGGTRAAIGAGLVGVLGLVFGHVPPPRVFLAGAIYGAAQWVQARQWQRGSTLIYLASVVPSMRPPASEDARRSIPR